MNSTEIKLLVCCHRPVEVPAHPLLVPIQVGAALSERHFPGFLHDDVGDNISARNRSYCELTAQYWAWKNITADYCGFFHYRRYLYPDACAKIPYRIGREATLPFLDKLGYSGFAELIEKYDLIIPMGEDMRISVREHYAEAWFHHSEDLELVERIVRERSPEMIEAMERYLSGTVCYFGNIYIMKRKVFQDYCGWLFPILAEFDRRVDTSNYSVQEKRVDGYLAERLLGIYADFRRSVLRTLELPRVHFYSEGEYAKRWLLNAVLPPGSRKRAFIKKIFV